MQGWSRGEALNVQHPTWRSCALNYRYRGRAAQEAADSTAASGDRARDCGAWEGAQPEQQCSDGGHQAAQGRVDEGLGSSTQPASGCAAVISACLAQPTSVSASLNQLPVFSTCVPEPDRPDRRWVRICLVHARNIGRAHGRASRCWAHATLTSACRNCASRSSLWHRCGKTPPPVARRSRKSFDPPPLISAHAQLDTWLTA